MNEAMKRPATKATLLCQAVMAVLLGLMLVADAPASEPEKGSEQIVLTGGASGDVAFPHRRHQQNLGACDTCHSLYPQEAGSIDRLKERNQLKPKTVMNQQCTSCHREKKRSGQSTGPTTCKGCHQKN
jgi:hypothetical protein